MAIDVTGNDMKITSEMMLELRSPVFSDQGRLPDKYTYLGENINPPLEIVNVPTWAKSLILLVEDLDVPDGFINWLVYNIDPETRTIEEDSLPGTPCMNSSREFKYVGCMPLVETHNIRFNLFAVDSILDLREDTNKIDLMKKLQNYRHVRTSITGIVYTEADHWAIE